MPKRFKMSGRHSRSHFTRHASRIHKKNLPRTHAPIMRGGIRL